MGMLIVTGMSLLTGSHTGRSQYANLGIDILLSLLLCLSIYMCIKLIMGSH